jgi:hypothetical protein
MISLHDRSGEAFNGGAKALAKVEGDGIRMDVCYLDRTIKRRAKKFQGLEAQLKRVKLPKNGKDLWGKMILVPPLSWKASFSRC